MDETMVISVDDEDDVCDNNYKGDTGGVGE